VTTPPERVTVRCPHCGHVYDDWYRPSINLDIEHFDDAYLDAASSAVCPTCEFKVYFDSLIVRDDTLIWEQGDFEV
jgi:DNA-directed RNA polymerase subunit RPC12/RpoP